MAEPDYTGYDAIDDGDLVVADSFHKGHPPGFYNTTAAGARTLQRRTATEDVTATVALAAPTKRTVRTMTYIVTGATTVTLQDPAAWAATTQLPRLTFIAGDAGAKTLDVAGGHNINGAPTLVLAAEFDSVVLIVDVTGDRYLVVASS